MGNFGVGLDTEQPANYNQYELVALLHVRERVKRSSCRFGVASEVELRTVGEGGSGEGTISPHQKICNYLARLAACICCLR